MDDSVNIPSLVVNDVKVAESKLIPEKSRKRYLKEYELFNPLLPELRKKYFKFLFFDVILFRTARKVGL